MAYLGLRPGQAHSRDKLAAVLWGDRGDEQARDSLRHTLVELRRALPDHSKSLVADGRDLSLNPAAVEVDVTTFEECVSTGTAEALAEAEDLYRGDFLDGFALREPTFEEWLVTERERLREMALDGLRRLLEHQQRARALEPAIRTAARLLALDATLEVAHRTLMRLYLQQGRRGAALRQYQSCVALLQRELGAEPDPETRKLYQEIVQRGEESTGARPRREPSSESRLGVRPDAVVTDTPLIGRSTELATLQSSLEDARWGRGRLVTILGEAGVGKSRLALELAGEAWRSGWTILVGHAYASTQSLPFAPWVDALRTGGVPGDRALLKSLGQSWRRELARLFPELAEPAVATTADPGSAVRLFEAIAQLMAHLAARQPLLLVLEDLHWADASSVQLLAFAARRAPQSAVLLLATAREEDLAEAAGLSGVLQETAEANCLTRLPLRALSREEMAGLVHALVRTPSHERMLTTLTEQVWVISEGNPFTAVETLRAVREGATASTTHGLALPQRVREVIAGRLDRLRPQSRELAGIAAVIGRAFDFALLRLASGLDERETAEAVDELVRRRILRDLGSSFDFTHDRIRTVAHETLLGPRRQAIHAAVGRALEELHATEPERVWSRLAYHYANAEHADKAVRYLSRSADQAARVYAHVDALTALQQAEAFLERLPADATRERTALALTLREAQSLYFLGRFRESVDLLERHERRVDQLDDPSFSGSYRFWLGHMYARLGDRERATSHARRALEEATRAGDTATLGKAHGVLGLESYWLGRPQQGLEHEQQAITLLERAGETWWLAMAHFYLGMNALLAGRFHLGLDAAERARELGESLEDRRLQSYGLFLGGWVHATRGEPAIAIEKCEQSLALAADPVNACYATALLGYANLEDGNDERAISLLEQAVRELERFDFRQWQGWFTVILADAELRHGRPAAARELASRGLTIVTGAGFRAAMGWARHVLGRAALAGARLDAADEELSEASRIFDAIEAPFEQARLRLDLAVLGHARGATDAAAQHLRAALHAFSELEVPAWTERAYRLAAELGISLAMG
jgi:DNA-binding SARP family transcriptional activator